MYCTPSDLLSKDKRTEIPRVVVVRAGAFQARHSTRRLLATPSANNHAQTKRRQPGARVFISPVATIVASVVFAEISAVGGMVLSPAPGVPVSVFVTTISFAIFLLCWAIGRRDRVAQGA